MPQPALNALDHFGEILMTKVRDEAIWQWSSILNGSMKCVTAETICGMFSECTDEQKIIIMSLIHSVVDTTLHHLLWTFEQSNDVHIRMTYESQDIPSLKDLSDGLPGELYAENGWIARFSKVDSH